MNDTRAALREFFDNRTVEGLAGHEEAAASLAKLNLEGLPSLRLAVLRTVTVEPLDAYLRVAGYRAGLQIELTLHNLGEVETLVLDRDSPLYRENPDAVLVLLNLESVAPQLVNRFTDLDDGSLEAVLDGLETRILGLAKGIARHSGALIIISNFQLPVRPSWGILDGRGRPGQRDAIAGLNSRISQGLSQMGNAYTLDIERLTAILGDRAANDPRNWHRAQAPWKPALLEAIARESMRYLRPLRSLNKKCVVLDCDNVLWGGVAAEVGFSEIGLGPEPSGSPFVSLQNGLRAISARGVVLAVCSKNDRGVVDEVFYQHPNMVLTPEDIATWRVNWDDKASNIVDIAAELNIGIDSIVFLDDSPFECGLVRQALPEVEVVCLDGNPGNFRRIIEELDYIDPLSLTEEDVQRTSLYRGESQRRELAAQLGTVEEYLATLNMTVEVARVDQSSVSRVAQLILKTNQFNTTTPRYTETDIRAMMDGAGCIVASMRVSDIYGDSGLVGAAILFFNESHVELDAFLMSCRVIGRGAEDAFLAALTQEVSKHNIGLVARYVPTRKNSLVEDFLPRCGLKLIATDESCSNYALGADALPLTTPAHVHLVNKLADHE